MKRLRPLAPLVGATVLAVSVLAVPNASAAGGSADVLIVRDGCTPTTRLVADVLADPRIRSVATFSAEEGSGSTPSAADLAGKELVVTVSDCRFADPEALGDRLADYVDGGGRVLEYAYSNFSGVFPGSDYTYFGTRPGGRFVSGGFEPFVPGPNTNQQTSLGVFNASDPLMAGVTELSGRNNTSTTLAPGASLVASWSDGRPAIARKARVVSVSMNPSDSDSAGDFGRLTANAAVPALAVGSPSPLVFPAQARETVSASRTITFTIEGTPGAELGDLEIVGPDADDFWLTAESCPTAVPTSGTGTCTAKLRFVPSAQGDRVATLRFSTDTDSG
ncbi:MAG: hypothetical protein Q7T71_21020, partial [Herbiconiux sp.]|nr:hypothetical protein [Herbiconiux sp.]